MLKVSLKLSLMNLPDRTKKAATGKKSKLPENQEQSSKK
jgi:hypothetical protein